VDAIILAAEGILSSSLPYGAAINSSLILPSPGQGITVVESRCGDEEAFRIARLLDHTETRLCVEEERAFLRTLGQDCMLPAGAYARLCGYVISIEGMLGNGDALPTKEEVIRCESKGGKLSGAASQGADY